MSLAHPMTIHLDELSGFVQIAVGGDDIGQYRREIPATNRDILREALPILEKIVEEDNDTHIESNEVYSFLRYCERLSQQVGKEKEE